MVRPASRPQPRRTLAFVGSPSSAPDALLPPHFATPSPTGSTLSLKEALHSAHHAPSPLSLPLHSTSLLTVLELATSGRTRITLPASHPISYPFSFSSAYRESFLASSSLYYPSADPFDASWLPSSPFPSSKTPISFSPPSRLFLYAPTLCPAY